MKLEKQQTRNLLSALKDLISNAKGSVASNINSGMILLYWQIGSRIRKDILQNQRAEYGKEIVVSLSRDLVEEYGRSYEEKNLRRMIQFSERFSDVENVVTLSRHLSWSHFLALIPLERDAIQFYSVLAYNNAFGVRTLREQISKKTFERTENANLQIEIESPVEAGVFKDPYFLDFLQLPVGFLERDLESAILKDLENFILELGLGFSFVERQKRMIIDGDDYYLDLLFFHRKLKRLVAIELKIDKFKAKYKGQMELYLKWLNRYEKQEGEQSPIGLILCAETSSEQVELLEMHKDGIIVAEYWTELPPKEVLETKLQKLLLEAKERMAQRKLK
jgi:predicted nuclease of restriction endonuclease-like (RecB) superfamily